jgi:hypothetical protein
MIDLKLCITTLARPGMAEATFRHKGGKLEKIDELVGNTIWRLLDLRGCVFPSHD